MSGDELEAYCLKWLRDRRGKLTLQRTLYLVPGLDDEGAGCWSAGGAAGTIFDDWGPHLFTNWHAATSDEIGTPAWDAATVRLVRFPLPYPANFAGTDFRDFGVVLRALIARHYPDHGSHMGEYDLVCHSMGGLDAVAALLDMPPANAPPAPANAPRAANVYNLVTLDTPYRGVPNMAIRRKFSPPYAQGQCSALMPGCAELRLVDERAEEIAARATRITCYGVDTASQIEVASANLYQDRERFDHQRHITDYRFVQIPGASHSGALGITRSPVTIANLFDTITRSERLSTYT